MITVIIAVILASLLGSPHCACMCGPIVMLTMGMEGKTGPNREIQIVLYHFGRLLAYISLGALASLMATVLDQTGFLVGVQNCSAFLAALILLLFGYISISRAYGNQLPVRKVPDLLLKFISMVHGNVLTLKPYKRALMTGVLTSMLPCGWLYIFVAMAGGTGSFFFGVVIMVAFWIGTLPVLTVFTLGIQKFTSRLSPKIRLIPAIVIILLGIVTVSSRIMTKHNPQISPFEISQLFNDNLMSLSKSISKLQTGCKNHDK